MSLPVRGTLEYDLAVALHSGCALIRRDDFKHEFEQCPSMKIQLIYACDVTKKLEIAGHILTEEGLANAIHLLEYDGWVHTSNEMAKELWKEMHARTS